MSTKHPIDHNNNERFGDIIRQMNQFFQERKGILQSIDEFFRTPFPHSSFALEMTENEQEHLIIAELPGVKREQIGIDVLGNSVTITVNHSEEITEQDESRKTLRKRQSLSRSSRTVALPFPINEQVVKATYTNGLLQIRIPKKRGKKVIIDQD